MRPILQYLHVPCLFRRREPSEDGVLFPTLALVPICRFCFSDRRQGARVGKLLQPWLCGMCTGGSQSKGSFWCLIHFKKAPWDVFFYCGTRELQCLRGQAQMGFTLAGNSRTACAYVRWQTELGISHMRTECLLGVLNSRNCCWLQCCATSLPSVQSGAVEEHYANRMCGYKVMKP